jgi:hypothetical protein
MIAILHEEVLGRDVRKMTAILHEEMLGRGARYMYD